MTILRVPQLDGSDKLPDDFLPARLADAALRELGTGNPYRRSIVHELPIRFPGYATVIAAKGYDYLFPQAFTIHEDRAYVLYGGGSNAGANLGSWVSVHNFTTGSYVSGFSLPGARYGEGIVVTRSGDNLHLYAMHTGTAIGRWDITTLPADRATLPAPTVFEVNLQSQFTYDGDKFTVQTVGEAISGVRHRFTRYNGDLTTFNSALKFDPSDAWPITADLIPLNVKAQGIAAFRGGYAMIYGGTHYFGGTLSPDKRPGIRLFTDSGEKTTSALMDPDTFITALRAAGATVDLIEGEGIAAYDGDLYALWATSSHTNTGAYGLLITQELGGDINCTSAARRGTLTGVAKHNGRINSSTAGIKNPLTGAAFVSLAGVLEFMRDTDTNRYGFHTTGSAIADVAGNELPSGCLVEITTGNFFSWTVTVRGLNRQTDYWVSGNEGELIQETVFDRRTGAGDPEGGVTAGVGATYLRTSGGANTTLYVKTSGTGSTGWTAK